MEKRKISEENIFTKDHIKILKEIISSYENEINKISIDSQLRAKEKNKKLELYRDEIIKAKEILNNPDLMDAYIKFCTVTDIDLFVTALFNSTGLGIIKKPISIDMLNDQKIETQVSEWNIDKEDLIEFIRNKNTITVIEELYQKAGYKMSDLRFNSYDGNEYYETLGYSTIPQIYDSITRLSNKYVPESIVFQEKGL